MTERPIAGIDVAKNFSEMVVISPSCQIIARLQIKHQSSSDLKKAADILKKVEKDFAAAPVVVMESTGHYHKILFHYFTKIGLEVVILNPLQSDSIKNISIRKVKNDKIDAFRIAMLYKLNQSNIATLPLETIECLKRLCRQYYHFNDELIAYKNRLMSVVNQIMLNFREVFPDICSKTALAVLEKYPTPEDILNADRNELISVIQQNSHKSYLWACEKCELLYKESSGV